MSAITQPGKAATRVLPPVTADLPEGSHGDPVAPWRVSARYEFSSARVELEVFSVTQDGPDEPRVLRRTSVVMDAEQAQVLTDALDAAIQFCEGSES